jgi:hypothetical protein
MAEAGLAAGLLVHFALLIHTGTSILHYLPFNSWLVVAKPLVTPFQSLAFGYFSAIIL